MARSIRTPTTGSTSTWVRALLGADARVDPAHLPSDDPVIDRVLEKGLRGG